jgi:hypothetical protein
MQSRLSKIEQGIVEATGALASLERQHQALVREMASLPACPLIENDVARGAASNPIACNSPPKTQSSSADAPRLDQLQGDSPLPLYPAPPGIPLDEFSASPEHAFTTTVLPAQEPGNEDPSMIPHEIGSEFQTDPLLPDRQDLGLVHKHDYAEAAAMVSLEIGEVSGELEFAGEVGSTALIPGSAQIDLTESPPHVPDTCVTASDTRHDFYPSPAST